MTKVLVLVHTVPPLIGVFDRLAGSLLPGVRVLHVLDEPLLERVRLRGAPAPEDAQRLSAHVDEAAAIGALAVLVTCSTVSPCVDLIRERSPVPLLRIDERMIELAVQMGERIGVLATNRTTLEPTRTLLLAEANRVGKGVSVELVMVDGALPSLLAGDGATHDRLVLAALAELRARVDVVILAQASIARVIEVLPPDGGAVPVLSSPHLALREVAELMEERVVYE
jgi:Asp/Glu/hydantoin racemase